MSRTPSPVDIWCANCGLRHDDDQRRRILARISMDEAIVSYPCLFSSAEVRRRLRPGAKPCTTPGCTNVAGEQSALCSTCTRRRWYARNKYKPCPKCGGQRERSAKACRGCAELGRPRKNPQPQKESHA